MTPVTVPPTPRPAAPTTPPAVLETPPTALPRVEVTKVTGLLPLSSRGILVVGKGWVELVLVVCVVYLGGLGKVLVMLKR